MKKKEEMLNNKYIKVNMNDAVWDGDRIWFCARNFNSLFCIDVKTGEIEHVGVFPDEPYSVEVLYMEMELVDNKLYCFPSKAKSIAVYDIIKKEFYKIALDENILFLNKETWRFCGVKRYKKFLFVLPIYSKCIIRLNLETDEVEYLNEWLEEYKENDFDETESFFWKNSVLIDNKIYAPFVNVNGVLELNCDTLKSVIHKIDGIEGGFTDACYLNGGLWMTSYKTTDLVCWSQDDDTIKIICTHSRENKQLCPYVGIKSYKNKIMLFPRLLREEFTDKYEYSNIVVMEGQYFFVKENEGELIYYELDNSILTKMDLRTGRKKEIKILLNSLFIDTEKLFDGCERIKEERGIECILLIDYLEKKNNAKTGKEQGLLSGVGDKIYRLIETEIIM